MSKCSPNCGSMDVHSCGALDNESTSHECSGNCGESAGASECPELELGPELWDG